jgi:O-antigen ligase
MVNRIVKHRQGIGWRVGVFVLLSLLVFSPLNTKVAGVLWFFTLLIALGLALTHRSAPVSTGPVVQAARLWLLYMLGATLLWWTSAWIWNDPWAQGSADLHSAARLLSAALAAWTILRLAPGRVELPSSASLVLAVSLACLSAYILSLLITREHYPSNAVPWAAGIACLVCVLFPVAIARESTSRVRLLALLGSALGILALFENQTRGAYGVAIWLLLLWMSTSTYFRQRAALSIFSAITLLILIGSTALTSNDPLRIRSAWSEAKASVSEKYFNTSIGARVFLYRMSIESISQNPLTGVGSAGRMALIKGAGSKSSDSTPASLAHVTELGHVHNAYLHHLLDGGLISLAGFLLTLAGMVSAGWILYRFSHVAAWQLWGIAFVHATTNLSNVNLAHNYYALMLSVSLFLVFLSAQRQHL